MTGLPVRLLKVHFFEGRVTAPCGIPRGYAEDKGTIAERPTDVTCKYCLRSLERASKVAAVDPVASTDALPDPARKSP